MKCPAHSRVLNKSVSNLTVELDRIDSELSIQQLIYPAAYQQDLSFFRVAVYLAKKKDFYLLSDWKFTGWDYLESYFPD